MTFLYLTIPCIPAIGYVPNIFWTVADILRQVPSNVPDIDCSWHFTVLYRVFAVMSSLI